MSRFFAVVIFGILGFIGIELMEFSLHAEAWQKVDLELRWDIFADILYWLGGAWLVLFSFVVATVGFGCALMSAFDDKL